MSKTSCDGWEGPTVSVLGAHIMEKLHNGQNLEEILLVSVSLMREWWVGEKMWKTDSLPMRLA